MTDFVFLSLRFDLNQLFYKQSSVYFRFCVFIQIYTPAGTVSPSSSVCLKCGIIAKSGKISCCGRGGSWFGNCGNAGTAKRHYTWHEGIQACKILSHSKTVISRQSNATQQQNILDWSDSPNPKTVITSEKVFKSTSTNTPTSFLVRTLDVTPAIGSIDKSTTRSDATFTRSALTSAINASIKNPAALVGVRATTLSKTKATQAYNASTVITTFTATSTVFIDTTAASTAAAPNITTLSAIDAISSIYVISQGL